MKKIFCLILGLFFLGITVQANSLSVTLDSKESLAKITLDGMPSNKEGKTLGDVVFELRPDLVVPASNEYQVDSVHVEKPSINMTVSQIHMFLVIPMSELRVIGSIEQDLSFNPTKTKRTVSFSGNSAKNLYLFMKNELKAPSDTSYKEMLVLDVGLKNETSVRCLSPKISPLKNYSCTIGGS